MNLKKKMIVGSVLLASIPVLIASLLTQRMVSVSSHEALKDAAQQQLISVRVSTKTRISEYLKDMRSQAATFSESHTIRQAMVDFSDAAETLAEESGLSEEQMRSALSSQYNQFDQTYKQSNPGKTISTGSWLNALNKKGLALQYQYINKNPHPAGERHQLDAADDGSRYSKAHAEYHPVIRDYLERFGYYDIFLADLNGQIIYSTYKELDLGVSLLNGPLSQTKIADVFKQALEADTNSDVVISGIATYAPSADAFAGFLSAPIMDKGKKIGVLLFQMPLANINNIMTHNNDWQEAGLGLSGETYLVGTDSTLRSASRFLIEDKAGYLLALKQAGADSKIIQLIDSKNDATGLHKIDTEGSRAALAGKEGFAEMEDYRGVKVFSAYTSINLGKGHTWGLLAEIDEAEAVAAADALEHEILVMSSSIAAILIIIAAAIGAFFAQNLVKPILQLYDSMQQIETDSDLTIRVDINSKDEIGLMATAFNKMLVKFHTGMQQVASATDQLASAAEETSAVTAQTNASIQNQLSETTQVATAMNEMSATVNDVASNITETAKASEEANQETQASQQILAETVVSINGLVSRIEEATEVIQQLEQHSTSINSVLDVIKDVAEQTNLLALNAAIEAARAGEHGRGFAVVADEVRNLASRTQQSTSEINQMIEKLQTGSKEAVGVMTSSQEQAQSVLSNSARVETSLDSVTNKMQLITDMSNQIATASKEQTVVTEEINRSIVSINNMAQENSTGSGHISAASEDLSRLASELLSLSAQFKI